MPAQYIKPYAKANKSDYIDAEAIAEAVGRPKMRFVTRTHSNVAAVALANKLARMAWAVLAKNGTLSAPQCWPMQRPRNWPA
jgi:hypothetical protein